MLCTHSKVAKNFRCYTTDCVFCNVIGREKSLSGKLMKPEVSARCHQTLFCRWGLGMRQSLFLRSVYYYCECKHKVQIEGKTRAWEQDCIQLGRVPTPPQLSLLAVQIVLSGVPLYIQDTIHWCTFFLVVHQWRMLQRNCLSHAQSHQKSGRTGLREEKMTPWYGGS